MKRPLLLLLASLCLLQLPATAQYSSTSISDGLKKLNPQSQGPVLKPEEIRDKAANSTVYIEVGGGIGTGWFVAPGWAVTNHHVIADGIDGFVEVNGPHKGGLKGRIGRVVADDKAHDLAIVEIRYATLAEQMPAEPVGTINDILKPKGAVESAMDDSKRELARLKKAQEQGKGKLANDIPALPLADSSFGLKEGQAVYEYGNPKGYKGTFSAGNISAFRDGQDLQTKFKTEAVLKVLQGGGAVGIDSAKTGEIIQYTTPSSHGSSGSAVLNDRGRVVGVCFAGEDEGQNLNFAISAKYVSELLTRAQAGLSTQ